MKNIFRNKMYSRIRTVVVGLLITMYVVSCTEDFAEMNRNPNGATDIPTTYLLTSAQQKLITINSSLGFNKTMMLWTQQWAQRETTNRSRYDLAPTGDWNSFYTSGIPDLVSIIELNQGEFKDDYNSYGDNDNRIAVARIMKAWAYSLMTDAWGDIPYSQAHNRDYSFPAYDLQSEIYPDLIKELNEAAAQIKESEPGFISGDLMYDGDMTKWKKFANSLRARLAVRMMKANSTLAQSELADALSSPIFESNDDNALINFQNSDDYANPIYAEFLTQNWTFPTKMLVDTMLYLNDPRLPIYTDTTENASVDDYVGLQYGLEDAASTLDPNTKPKLSKIGAFIREQSFPSILMSYSELMFIKAEAAEKGWVAGDAAALYDAAITANMAFWGVDAADITTYLSEPDVVYNAGTSDELIGLQRWLSLYTQGAQAYFEWRRTGQPGLTIPATGFLFNEITEMPRRYFYPITEAQLNGENLQAAQDRLSGGDKLTSKIWIDQ
ncbi:MAG: SusD/RagB family nutrient-binding outer membrane lipoprotein [Bacteroidota bacterium]